MDCGFYYICFWFDPITKKDMFFGLLLFLFTQNLNLCSLTLHTYRLNVNEHWGSFFERNLSIFLRPWKSIGSINRAKFCLWSVKHRKYKHICYIKVDQEHPNLYKIPLSREKLINSAVSNFVENRHEIWSFGKTMHTNVQGLSHRWWLFQYCKLYGNDFTTFWNKTIGSWTRLRVERILCLNKAEH